MVTDFSTSRKGQALVEVAVGMLALALVVSVLCGFALYITKSLEIQNKLRVGGKRCETVEVSDPMTTYLFGSGQLKASEELSWPSTIIVR